MNLEEIKAREQAATPGPWESKTHHTKWGDAHEVLTSYELNASNPYTKVDCDFIAHARTDIPELIAEVERLNEVISSMDDMHTRLMRAEEQKLNRVSVERNAFEAENATLKKALELAVQLMRDSKVPVTVESFIQQAEQLTHETDGALESEGKK